MMVVNEITPIGVSHVCHTLSSCWANCITIVKCQHSRAERAC